MAYNDTVVVVVVVVVWFRVVVVVWGDEGGGVALGGERERERERVLMPSCVHSMSICRFSGTLLRTMPVSVCVSVSVSEYHCHQPTARFRSAQYVSDRVSVSSELCVSVRVSVSSALCVIVRASLSSALSVSHCVSISISVCRCVSISIGVRRCVSVISALCHYQYRCV